MVYRYRYLCQLVNEPQVHRCASAQCDELSADICLGMLWCNFVPQRPAHCSVEMWRVDGQQEWHHLRLTGLRGRGGHVGLFRIHLGSLLSSVYWWKNQTQLEVQLSLLLQWMLVSLLQVLTSEIFLNYSKLSLICLTLAIQCLTSAISTTAVRELWSICWNNWCCHFSYVCIMQKTYPVIKPFGFLAWLLHIWNNRLIK